MCEFGTNETKVSCQYNTVHFLEEGEASVGHWAASREQSNAPRDASAEEGSQQPKRPQLCPCLGMTTSAETSTTRR